MSIKQSFMRKATIFSFLFLYIITSYAGNIDSLRLRDFRASFSRAKVKNPKNDRLVFQFGMDNLTYKRNDSFSIKGFSPSFGMYFMYDDTIKNSAFSIAPGIGFNFISYNTNFMLKSDTSGIAFVRPAQFDPSYAPANIFKGGTFYVSYIEVPFELRYRKAIREGNFLKIAVGFKVGLKLTSSYDWDAFDGSLNDDRNYKISPFTQVSTFRYGPTFRVGYGAFNLYGFYGANKLFKTDTDLDKSEFHQFSIGLSINGL